MKKIICYVIILVFLLQSLVYADTKEFMEIDEELSGFRKISYTQNLSCIMPFRYTGGLTERTIDLNAPFNEPRPFNSYYYGTHRGIDVVPHNLTEGTGKSLYPIHDGGTVKNVVKNIGSSYGRTITIQYEYQENGYTYEFQSFYAHMASVENLSVNDDVNVNQVVGIMGKSGTSEETYQLHLHMEIRGAIGSASGENTEVRKYSPEFFFPNLSNSSDLAFINRIYADTDTVTFRIGLIYANSQNNEAISSSQVRLCYKADGNTTWSSMSMTKSGNYFTANISNLYTGYIKYYVKVDADVWDSGTSYPVYRPYRYLQQAPIDRPFIQYSDNLVLNRYNYQSISSADDYCTVIDSDNSTICNNIDTNDEIWLLGTIVSVGENCEYIILKDKQNNEQRIIIENNDEYGIPLYVGMKFRARCVIENDVYKTNGMNYMVLK